LFERIIRKRGEFGTNGEGWGRREMYVLWRNLVIEATAKKTVGNEERRIIIMPHAWKTNGCSGAKAERAKVGALFYLQI